MGSRLRAIVSVMLLLAGVSATPPAAAWYRTDPGGVPVRPTLPNAIDLMESGLYWMQDMTGAGDPRDPATIINLMEEQAARYFDFAYIAYRVAGPDYTRLNALQRSHFQNRVRDWLFSALARQVGMYDVRMPHFWPLVPVSTSTTTWHGGGLFYHAGGPVIRLYFEFYWTPRGWRIFDVTSNGVSAVAELRRRFFRERFDDLPADSRLLDR
jgi:MlaC protein